MTLSHDTITPRSDNDALYTYQRIMESAGYVVFTVNEEGQFTNVSPGVKRLTGYTADEIVGKHFLTLVTADARHNVEAFYLHQLSESIPETIYQFPILTKTGEKRWVEQTVITQVDERGQKEFQAIVHDVTARKQSEDALRESEAKYRSVIAAMAEGIMVVDADGHILTANAGAERILGQFGADMHTCDEPSEWDVVHEDGTPFPKADNPLEVTLRTGKPQSDVIMGLRKPDGSRSWLAVNSQPLIQEGADRPYAVVISFADITERKHAERRLQESEERYRTLFDATFEAVIIHENGHVVDVNPAFEAMFGYSRSEAVGMDVLRFTVAEQHDMVRYRIRTNTESLSDSYGLRKDGTAFPVEVRAKSITYQGRAVRVVTLRDLTERKSTEAALRESEERYRAIVEDHTELICRFLPDGTLTFVNEAYCRYFGKSREELIGKSFMPVIPEEDLAGAEAHLASLNKDKPFGTFEHRVIMPNGEIRWQSWTDRLILDNAGELIEIQSVGQDITERKRAEHQREENAQRYKALFDQTNDAVFIVSLDLTYQTINAHAADMLGYTVEELIGESISKVVVPAEYPDAKRVLGLLMSGQSVPVYERTFRRKNGEQFPAEVSVSLVRDANGSPVYVQSVVRDITDRKRAEQALEASERRNRALLEAIPDTLFIVRKDGSFTELREQVGSGEWQWVTTGNAIYSLHPTDEIRAQSIEQIRKAIETGTIQSLDYHVDQKDDEPRYYNARMTALNGQEVLVAVRDVTDLRRAESWLSKHVEQLTTLRQVDTELADRLDVEYVVTMALDAAVRLSNADTGMIGLIDKDGVPYLARGIGSYDQETLADNLRHDRGTVARVFRCQEPELIKDVATDPDYVPVNLKTQAQMVFPLISQDTLVGVLNVETSRAAVFTEEVFEFLKLLVARIAVAIDNAQLHHKTEQQLIELQSLYQQVQRLEQMKTDMIRIASHDLRTPLGTITGYLEMLKADVLEAGHTEWLDSFDSIDRSASRMLKIVNDILSLERIEEAAQQAALERFDLVDMVRTVCQELTPQAQMKSQTMLAELTDRDLIVEGGSVQIQEAVSNLVNNAIKYTPSGGEIVIRLRSEGNQAAFEVEDNGYGVPEAQQARLFEPFFRAKSTETREIQGSGLGLHLVKNIIERYGGHITFKSAYGQGSTFGFELPLAHSAEQP